MKKAEFELQKRVAQFLRDKHPDVEFRSDLGGINLTIGQAVQVKKIQKSKKWPDMFISECRGRYGGLYLELKAERNDLFTMAGKMRESEHIKGQAAMLEKLTKKGYCAVFAVGYENCILLINSYLKLK